MADSELIDNLQEATGKTREECEAALTAANGDYTEAAAKLGAPSRSAPTVGILPTDIYKPTLPCAEQDGIK